MNQVDDINASSLFQRILFMLLFIVLYSIAEFFIYVVAAVQLLWVIFTGSPNLHLLNLGQGLSLWACEVFQFLTFNREALPYPFNPWPSK